ncbi:hypothetical protein [Variovorax paradoxus]|uniref:hypothetical protein n=1 Tax=Variovorax paradoxus TaxID=34073 RepID=UPI00039C5BC7
MSAIIFSSAVSKTARSCADSTDIIRTMKSVAICAESVAAVCLFLVNVSENCLV